ncbi:MAG TPA: 2-oxoacid:acceptor oxidoreductase subunit alpha [Smithellaceae bacterium]|mgnify:FL=1|nr:2-oxoacid:acceptor oxidoreductase subunit alpha [Smithellaceae bacterium]HNY96268.1 2-oxoacid:acceptor oxidoreductase subunit alpha [Smithellaceae bacterium]HOD63099.1 2-oxoacid:acceptor oxidoreductase subunit alpha [Smithellaceae bacterium]HOE23359.1 2-oxoacid:acceptor oxidoreductase subunit alpha [Smithellaceae bacterium]HOH56402.1 2-oxoacid:acceptor oxidoreductase subunit alpha [Smithellaceae bacterium]
MTAKEVRTGTHFMNGDEACCEAALAAGCRFFAGYPITPATEVAESMSRRLPEIGGIYIQMEDEIASMAAILGASWGGVKSMTSTSGPGFSLMMENIGLGICTETPCVVCNVQRAGPSTGLPTLVAQGDMMQARWGSHGHYEIIALSPSSPQEMFDFTIRAFNLSEYYRLPVILLADETIGHMNERVVIPQEEDIEIVNRRKPTVSREDYLPYEADADGIAPMANCGDGYRIHVTGLTHDDRGYPAMDAKAQEKMISRLVDKIRKNRDKIIRTQNLYLDDAEVVVVSYGISARSAMQAVRDARNEGIKAGLIKLDTVWPFPEELIRSVAPRTRAMIMAEINGGQMALELERSAGGACPVSLVSNLGGKILHPGLILNAVAKAATEKP